MDLALMAVDENGFVRPKAERLLQEIWPALNLDRGIIGIIDGEEEAIEAAILLRTAVMWYSDQEIVEERAIFVHPKYRNAKGGRASRLCEFAKSVADKLNLPLMIGVLSNTRTNAKVRLYERQFGNPAGAFFLYNARTGDWKPAD
jgi:GNAT superfamily N-acetyltransferase